MSTETIRLIRDGEKGEVREERDVGEEVYRYTVSTRMTRA